MKPVANGMPMLLHQFLAEAVQDTPEAVAIDIPPGSARQERQRLSFAALDGLSDRMALHLVPLIAHETIIALLLPRTSPMLHVAQLAVLKAGGAFTAIDPAFPDDRIREILADADAPCVLCDAPGLERMRGLSPDTVALLDPDCLTRKSPPDGARLPTRISPEQLAYVIYTSGTTGQPKGVLVEHRNIANLLASDIAEFGLTSTDRVVQGSSAAYDSSLEESWLAFAAGATLVVMDDAAARSGPDIVDWLHTERATVFCPPPTLLRSSGCRNPLAALPHLRLLYVGGEALPRDIADLWGQGRRLVNGYGPTECAVTCLRGDIRPGEAITIGQPIPNMQAWVLNDRLEIVTEGERGELCIGGAGVARGYRHRPELTNEKFIDHPRCGRVYRTGDLVHRDAVGNYVYHGRIDAQVKIRGYRVELAEIEARLAAIPGVRAAATRLQDCAGVPELVAFVVPTADDQPLDIELLKSALAATVPGYMVPRRFGVLPMLPTTVGGKLDRAALPVLATERSRVTQSVAGPETPMEVALAAAVADILGLGDSVSVEADFFEDLGGDSLSAALLVSLLRADTRTSWITVSDIYVARTIRALGQMRTVTSKPRSVAPALERRGTSRPRLAAAVQFCWLLGQLGITAWLGWATVFKLAPFLLDRLDIITFILLSPLILLAEITLYVPISVGFVVLLKRLLLGRYQPLRTPVWSGYYLRHWCVMQAARLIPWGFLSGTMFQQTALRALGARIGRNVHIHRGVDLGRGGWDLLEIGDNAAIGQDAHIGLVELDRGDIVIDAIAIAANATLQVRASVEGGCRIGAGSILAPLSVLNAGGTIPPGERWDGVPAQRIGSAPPPPEVAANAQRLSQAQHGLVVMAAEGALVLVAALPAQLMALGIASIAGISSADLLNWFFQPTIDPQIFGLALGLAVASIPVSLLWTAILLRAMGPIRPGAISRWSLSYMRVWLKSGMLSAAGEWLSGTLMWPWWLRLAGMKIGPNCEISTIIDVSPELVTIGADSFFADGIYLGGAEISRGTVHLAPVSLGHNSFLGNHAVIPAGETLPDDILIGIATVADARLISSGQSRFGHPSFDLPRRQIVALDRRLTHDPSAIRIANRMFWEVLRFVLPILPLLLLVVWYQLLGAGADHATPLLFALFVIPGATLVPLFVLCLTVLCLKWLLIGRVRPGQHGLWSCWASRWDFLFVAWGKYGSPILKQLEGTFLLMAYLRLMGVKIGRHAVLGPQFSQVVDPDMIEIGAGATVSAMFQAHTFEDRVLKIDKVRILDQATVSAGTVPLYGAIVGAGAHVGANSVIMKHEHLSPGCSYQGVPLRDLDHQT